MTAAHIKITCSRLITGTCDPSNVGSSTGQSSLDAGLGYVRIDWSMAIILPVC